MDKSISIQERVDALPLNLQKQISDYVDFVTSRYQEETELPSSEVEFLSRRMEKMKQNPEGNKEWGQARKELHKKLGWV